MEDYYQILEITPQASYEEIKSSYRQLCKEYHPDKLPPGTPEKARAYIEERFKQISSAYSVLIDEEQRKVYDRNNNIKSNTSRSNDRTSTNNYQKNRSNSNYSYSSSNSNSSSKNYSQKKQTYRSYDSDSGLFNAEKMKEVAEELKARKQEIEQEYHDQEKKIDHLVKVKLQLLGHPPEDLNKEYIQGETLLRKLMILLLAIVNTIAGVWLMGAGNANIIFALIGGAWAGGWLLYGLVVVFVYSTHNKKVAKHVREIREEAQDQKYQAKTAYQQKLKDFQSEQRGKINFFKYLPIETIGDQYISQLSDEDKFYLLQAISERQDRDKFNQNVLIALGIIIHLGVFSGLFDFRNNRF